LGAGLLLAGALAGAVSRTVEAAPTWWEAIIESESDVSMNTTAETVVALESSVAEPRGPKAV